QVRTAPLRPVFRTRRTNQKADRQQTRQCVVSHGVEDHLTSSSSFKKNRAGAGAGLGLTACRLRTSTFLGLVLIAASIACAGDWPMWGHDPSRNMVSSEKGLPTIFNPGTLRDDGTIDPATVSKNVKWVAKLGTQSYGNPTVSGGRVFIGTNNAWPHFREDLTGDYAVL